MDPTFRIHFIEAPRRRRVGVKSSVRGHLLAAESVTEIGCHHLLQRLHHDVFHSVFHMVLSSHPATPLLWTMTWEIGV